MASSSPCCWNGEATLDRLAELLIAVADLVEAEGRELRRTLVRTGWSLAFLLTMSLLAAAGATLCLWAGYQYLLAQIGTVKAALVSGLSALLLAGGFAWLAVKINR